MYKKTTHFLECKHCIGNRCKKYVMACNILGVTKNGKIKIEVFGERNWKNKEDKRQIRYVESNRIYERNTSHSANIQ